MTAYTLHGAVADDNVQMFESIVIGSRPAPIPDEIFNELIVLHRYSMIEVLAKHQLLTVQQRTLCKCLPVEIQIAIKLDSLLN